MRLQHGGNPYSRSGGQQRTDPNGTRKNQGSKRMEDANKSKGCGKFPGIRQFLLTFYSKLQPYRQTVKRTKRQERVEMGRGTPKSIHGTQREDHKLTSIGITKERRKIQSGNGCLRTCYRRSTIPRARREMKTHCFPIKNNATSGVKLRDLQQGTTSNSRSSCKMETISIGCSRTL